MIMEKQRTHLTPNEVQEFINLGVDFGETDSVWLHQAFEGWFHRPITNDEGIVGDAKESFHIDDILPAPSLPEVLEILPKHIVTSDNDYGSEWNLHLYYDDGLWKAEYLGDFDFFLYDTVQSSLLVAVAHLLRWVCENHPETLTKTK